MKSHVLRSVRKGIQFVGAETTKSSGAATYSANIPSLRTAGDLIVVAFGVTSTISGNIAMATPSGYTGTTDLYQAGGRNSNLTVVYKISDGTESTVTVTGDWRSASGSACVVQVWRNVNITTPMDVTHTTAVHADTGTPDPPSITPVTAGAVVLGVGFATSGLIGDLTAPSGTGNATAITNNDVTFVCSLIMCAYKGWTSGAYNMAAFGNASTSRFLSAASMALALRPAYSGSKPI